MDYRFDPVKRVAGKLLPPPDKSISHRALIIGAMCKGEVAIESLLPAADVRSSAAAVCWLGADLSDGRISGVGLRGVEEPDLSIDAGNAGTLIRMLPGWLAGQKGKSFTIDGDESIRRRPMERISVPLGQMGADIELHDERYPPLTVNGAELKGIEYELPVASAQVKSCILFAGLLAEGRTVVVERIQSRDHTERMLRQAGASIEVELADAGRRVSVATTDTLNLERIVVPGDFSSAAYALVAAAILPQSELELSGVGVNWTRTGLLQVLERMGADVSGAVESADSASAIDEPVSNLFVRGSELIATNVGAEEVPLMIDELPLVALLGVFAEGETKVEGAQELRHKESDRIAAVVDGLKSLGAEIEATDDGFVIDGIGSLRGGTIDAGGDHRMAMLGAIAGLVSREGVEVHGMESAEISYPNFISDLNGLTVR